ncbi:MAG: 5'/3'-nucleotidase SurE, partial [Blastomonas sp.]|nr:5'/3'-nucleotidase SurE [Blastomonas sp.]
MAVERIVAGARQALGAVVDIEQDGIEPVARHDGSNIADDVTYSGTVAGAMEGTLIGIRSIALSQSYHFHDEERVVPWQTAEALAPEVLTKLVAADLPRGTFLNVNFPNCEPDEVDGVEVTAQGKYVHGLWVDERKDGRGFPYY